MISLLSQSKEISVTFKKAAVSSNFRLVLLTIKNEIQSQNES